MVARVSAEKTLRRPWPHSHRRMNAPACISARRPGSNARSTRKRMDHVRPDLERHRHVRGARFGCEARSVAEQRLGRSDLNQGGREAAQIRVERRDARVLPVHGRRDIGLRQLDQIAFVDQRIDGVLGRHRRFLHCQVRQGETSQTQAGASLFSALSRLARAAVSPAPALSPPTTIAPGSKPLPAQEGPGFQRIVEGWETDVPGSRFL